MKKKRTQSQYDQNMMYLDFHSIVKHFCKYFDNLTFKSNKQQSYSVQNAHTLYTRKKKRKSNEIIWIILFNSICQKVFHFKIISSHWKSTWNVSLLWLRIQNGFLNELKFAKIFGLFTYVKEQSPQTPIKSWVFDATSYWQASLAFRTLLIISLSNKSRLWKLA